MIPLRFERRTHALEGRCSIQLSYGTSLNCGAKVRFFTNIANICIIFFEKYLYNGPGRLTIGIVTAWEYGHEHFNAAALTAFTVNDFKFVTCEVDIHLVSGIMLDMAYDMCHHAVTHEIVAETGMSVSVRVCLAKQEM